MPKVFISYRQLNDTQRRRVLAFAERVRGCCVEVILDQFYLEDEPGGPPEGWPQWSSEQAKSADTVIIIGNQPWFRCFDGTEAPGSGLGAACEAGILRQRLYDLSGINKIFRVVYFDESDRDYVSFELKRYHHFRAESDFPGLIRWLGGTPPPMSSSASPALIWPSRNAAFLPDLANRDEEFNFFAGTLSALNDSRVTLICADTDHGKTRLVAQLHRYGRQTIGIDACSFVDFKAGGTIDYLFDSLISELGGLVPGLVDRSPSRLCDGLKAVRRPLLITFDTFERATEDTRRFVEENFLANIDRTDAVRLLIAGQRSGFPDSTKAAWGGYAKRFDLGFISNPQPWIQWMSRRFPQITSDMVRYIVAATKGLPGTTANMLETLGSYSPAQLKSMGMIE